MLEKEKLIEMLCLMHKIRHFEERLAGLYDYTSFLEKDDIAGDSYDFASTGIIAGAVHLSIGQEGTEVGTCAASGGVFGPSFIAGSGAADEVPVDVVVPGCPPPPLAIIHALLVATGRKEGVSQR